MLVILRRGNESAVANNTSLHECSEPSSAFASTNIWSRILHTQMLILVLGLLSNTGQKQLYPSFGCDAEQPAIQSTGFASTSNTVNQRIAVQHSLASRPVPSTLGIKPRWITCDSRQEPRVHGLHMMHQLIPD